MIFMPYDCYYPIIHKGSFDGNAIEKARKRTRRAKFYKRHR
jgi:hypothetical protein